MRASSLFRRWLLTPVVSAFVVASQAATNAPSALSLPPAPTKSKAAPKYAPVPFVPATNVTRATATPKKPFNPDALAWKEKALNLKVKAGQPSVDFQFAFTNTTSETVVITGTQTSCGCTVARLPETPWKIAAGAHGEIAGSMNLLGKQGIVTKTVGVDYDGGRVNLSVTVDIPQPDPTQMREADRQRNLSVAAADRQAVFRGDCASCHATPTIGRRGRDLYVAACAICHDAPNRASMVPTLRDLKHPTDYDFWLTWIKNGKANSLMPAFDLKQGGILDQAQMESLAEYLDSSEFSKRAIKSSLPLSPGEK